MTISDELMNMTFANEAEESAWWEANEDVLAEEFEKATAEGGVGYCILVVRDAASVTKICLAPEDTAKARAQAGKRGLRFGAYMKMIIRDALRKAEVEQRGSSF
jgi:hypothetical protein